jgi:hypothetical protein
MNAQEIKPSLAAALHSLAQSQLQAQASRSIGLDATAIGVVGADAALAAIVAGVRPYHQVWSIALAAIGLSLGLALRALLVKGGKRAGPLVADILYDRETHDDEELEQWLIEDLAADMIVNRRALARKMPLLTGAIALMGLAIILAFAGLVV